jgi:malonate-semialdehyde dehydrogenase (acetylating)/methylmalonate-semialdehyde dehydrogenase
MDSDLPRGVINVVHGARETVHALLQHRGIRAISFVGSAPVAQYIYETAAKNGKRVQALAGAKNHLLVMPDADLQLTVDAVLSSAFGASGQRCLAGSVVVAVGEIGDKLVQELRTAAASFHTGPGEMEDSAMGPLIRSEARERVKAYIAKGVAEGAELVLDGSSAGNKGSKQGYFLGPTIFDRVQPDMSIAIDEIFGPILAVIRADDIDHALAIVNKSRFGNAASVFTRNGEAARKFRTEVEAGMIGINLGVAAPMAFFPFAGWKGSFFGDLHATGKDGVKFYTETRVVTERW